jgi:predicted TIM-barrel fold metal-dependent hydrolase
MDPAMHLIDADNHYYETRDSFTRHIEPSMRSRAIRPVVGDDGIERIVVGDRIFRFLPIDYDNVPLPGRQDLRVPVRPEWNTRESRLRVMDQQGIDALIMFPTIALFVEQSMYHDPELLYANLGSFNRWVLDEWGFGSDGRIYAAPIISLRDRDRAIAETEWALKHGARVLAVRPGHAYGRSPADPWFDGFWARVNEAKACIAFHTGDSGYRDLYAGPWGLPESHTVDDQSAFQWVTCYCERPIIDTIAALVLGNLFRRFPNVRVISLENGSTWVPYLFSVVDRMVMNGAPSTWIGAPPTEMPSAVLKRHFFVSPFIVDNMQMLAAVLGVSQIVFGSDYPHGEGRPVPRDFAEALVPLGPDATRAIMRDNTRGLLGLP